MCCLANTELHFWHPRKLILFIWMQDVAFSVGEILHHLSNWDFSSLSSFFYVLTQQQSISILYKSFKTDELLLMWDLLVSKWFLKKMLNTVYRRFAFYTKMKMQNANILPLPQAGNVPTAPLDLLNQLAIERTSTQEQALLMSVCKLNLKCHSAYLKMPHGIDVKLLHIVVIVQLCKGTATYSDLCLC